MCRGGGLINTVFCPSSHPSLVLISQNCFRKSGNSKWRQYILAAAVPAKSWVNFKKVAGSIPHRSTLGHANCRNLESLVHFFVSRAVSKFTLITSSRLLASVSHFNCQLKNCNSNSNFLSTAEMKIEKSALRMVKILVELHC